MPAALLWYSPTPGRKSLFNAGIILVPHVYATSTGGFGAQPPIPVLIYFRGGKMPPLGSFPHHIC